MAARSGPAGDPGGPSAEDVVATVRVHADRVHDAVRRLGCPPAVAVEVVETSALDLVDVLADRPEAVADPVGEWFGRARELAAVRGTGSPDLPLGGGLLAGDDGQEALAAALERLPEDERFAVLLRDSYDLPGTAVGAALGTDADSALDLVGRGRLALLPLVDGEPAPRVPAHLADLAALARVGEGGSVAARDATARRHALSCPDCRAVTDGQQRAHVLLSGLAVVALPEADRVGVLSRVGAAARAALPPSAALSRPQDAPFEPAWEPGPPGPSLSPLGVLLSVALATLLGLGLGVLLVRTASDDGTGEGTAPSDALLISPSPSPTSVPVSPPTLTFPQPRTTVFTIPPSPSPSPTPVREPLDLVLEPSSGPNGEQLTVRGTGWTPGAEVQLAYLDPLGRPTGARTTATVDEQGRFSAELIALDPAALPGEHVVQARDGEVIVEATYDVPPRAGPAPAAP